MSSTGIKIVETPSSAEFRLDQIFRSDALGDLREFRQRIPVLKQVTDEPLQIRLVLDANIVQRELRWRLRNRRQQEARSARQEAIDSGTLIPFAPTALIQEIDEHILDMSESVAVSEEQVGEEWTKFTTHIH